MTTGYPLSMYKTVNWKTGPARARFNLELKKNIKSKKPQAASSKPQASSFRRLKKNTILKYYESRKYEYTASMGSGWRAV